MGAGVTIASRSVWVWTTTSEETRSGDRVARPAKALAKFGSAFRLL